MNENEKMTNANVNPNATVSADALTLGKVTLTPRDRRQGLDGGCWAAGTIGGYRFEALLFPGPAADPGWAVPGSGGRITKLWLTGRADGRRAYEWDRGPAAACGGDEDAGDDDLPTAEARAAVARLAATLPDRVYGTADRRV
jgi:hypothetical protein